MHGSKIHRHYLISRLGRRITRYTSKPALRYHKEDSLRSYMQTIVLVVAMSDFMFLRGRFVQLVTIVPIFTPSIMNVEFVAKL